MQCVRFRSSWTSASQFVDFILTNRTIDLLCFCMFVVFIWSCLSPVEMTVRQLHSYKVLIAHALVLLSGKSSDPKNFFENLSHVEDLILIGICFIWKSRFLDKKSRRYCLVVPQVESAGNKFTHLAQQNISNDDS